MHEIIVVPSASKLEIKELEPKKAEPVKVVTKAKAKKAAKAKTKKVAVVKAKETAKPKARRARYELKTVASNLEAWKTSRQLAKALHITPPAALNYLNQLKESRKVETKQIRQGLRGPLATAYRVA